MTKLNKQKPLPFPGADLIERKTPRLIARPLVGREKGRGSLGRHEWLGIAHDEIGACEGDHLLFPLL